MKPVVKAMVSEEYEDPPKSDETYIQLSSSTSLNFTLKESPVASIPGSALVIPVPDLAPNTLFTLEVKYTTLSSANAFSWLSSEQTLGKKMPYLFTQC